MLHTSWLKAHACQCAQTGHVRHGMRQLRTVLMLAAALTTVRKLLRDAQRTKLSLGDRAVLAAVATEYHTWHGPTNTNARQCAQERKASDAP